MACGFSKCTMARSRHIVYSMSPPNKLRCRAVISIVDDDPSVREAMLGLVRSLGFDAVTFPSAEDFLQSEQIDETTCLITDVHMPGLTGVELQSHLISRGSAVPIIFVTASPERRIEAQVRSVGAVGFLSKPFDDKTLIECLHQ